MNESELQYGFDLSKVKDFVGKNKKALAGAGAILGVGGLALKGMRNKKQQAQAKLDSERKAQEDKEKAKTKRTLIIAGSAVALVGVIALVIYLKKQGKK